MTIDWARQHEHDPNPAKRREARQALRAHYLGLALVAVFTGTPIRSEQAA